MKTDPTKATRRQRVEEKEQAILAAARAVFLEYGREGARMAEIGRRAGIAEGTVYLYFKTKHDLLSALVAEFWTTLRDGAQTVVDATDATFDKLRALADFHYKELINQADFIALTLVLERQSGSDIQSRALMRRYVKVFDDVFQQGLDRNDLMTDIPMPIIRDMFYGTLEHAGRTSVLHGGAYNGSVIDNIMTVFERSYGRNPNQPDHNPLIDRLEKAVTRLESL